MKIRPMKDADYKQVEELARSLRNTADGKGWFTEGAYQRHIPFDIRIQKGFVAEEAGRIFGFITYTSYDSPPLTPLVSWIAVARDCHRQGIGARLVTRVEKEILKTGIEALYVETPTKEAGAGSEYEGTYKFYQNMGFELERVRLRNAPDNNCDCDMAVLRKVLG